MFSFIRLAVGVVSLHSNTSLSITQVSTRELSLAVTDLTTLSIGMWTLGLWIRKGLLIEFFKGEFNDHSRSLEVSGVDSSVDKGISGQEISEKNIAKWPRVGSCDILVKNVAAFYPSLSKNLSEAKLKTFG